MSNDEFSEFQLYVEDVLPNPAAIHSELTALGHSGELYAVVALWLDAARVAGTLAIQKDLSKADPRLYNEHVAAFASVHPRTQQLLTGAHDTDGRAVKAALDELHALPGPREELGSYPRTYRGRYGAGDRLTTAVVRLFNMIRTKAITGRARTIVLSAAQAANVVARLLNLAEVPDHRHRVGRWTGAQTSRRVERRRDKRLDREHVRRARRSVRPR